MARGLGYGEIRRNVDLYPADVTNIFIRRVKRQSGIAGSCVDCINEHLGEEKKRKEKGKNGNSFVVREKEKVKSLCNNNNRVCF